MQHERDARPGARDEESIDSDHVETESSYDCPSCGEEIVIPLDPSAGSEQEYVEDCPVCCAPVVLRVRLDPGGGAFVSARAE